MERWLRYKYTLPVSHTFCIPQLKVCLLHATVETAAVTPQTQLLHIVHEYSFSKKSLVPKSSVVATFLSFK